MGAEIVENDDVAGLEGRDQLLSDVGVETFVIDRAIEDAGRGHLVAAQRTEESQPGVSRPEGFHLPASRRTVREPLDSHRSHQVNVFVPNACQCTKRSRLSRASCRRNCEARVLWNRKRLYFRMIQALSFRLT